MKLIKLEVRSIRDSESVVANLTIEKQKGETWNRARVDTVTSGTPEATREIVLGDDERLIIEGRVDQIVEYDREQGSAKMVPADPDARAKLAAEEKATNEANIKHAEIQKQQDEAKAKALAAQVPKTNLGNPVQTSDAPVNTKTAGDTGQGAVGTQPDKPGGTSQSPANTMNTPGTPGAGSTVTPANPAEEKKP